MKCLECASPLRWVLLGELRIYKEIIDEVIQKQITDYDIAYYIDCYLACTKCSTSYEFKMNNGKLELGNKRASAYVQSKQ